MGNVFEIMPGVVSRLQCIGQIKDGVARTHRGGTARPSAVATPSCSEICLPQTGAVRPA